MLKQFCKYGHPLTDTVSNGRNGQRRCRPCHQRWSHETRDRRGLPTLVRISVPVAPIFAVVDRMRIEQRELITRLARTRGVSWDTASRSVFRMKEAGRTTLPMADDLCVALGRHPAEVYGPDWFTFGEVADAV